MKTIFKYAIRPNSEGDAQVQMPEFAQILSVGHQGDPSELVVWASVEPANATITRFFQIRGTGAQLGGLIDIDGKYIGTVNYHPVPLVWHLYEVKP